MTDPLAIRATVLATPGVAAMHAGPHGTASTFAAEGRVWGVRVAPDRIDVHIVVEAGTQLADLGRAVRDAVRGVARDDTGDVVVHIEDLIVVPPTSPPDPAATEALELARTEEPRRIP